MQEQSTGQSTATATPTAEPVLVLQEIRKSYGKTQALISLDLRLRPGAVHGLVGENGAGKSTLREDPQWCDSARRGFHRAEW